MFSGFKLPPVRLQPIFDFFDYQIKRIFALLKIKHLLSYGYLDIIRPTEYAALCSSCHATYCFSIHELATYPIMVISCFNDDGLFICPDCLTSPCPHCGHPDRTAHECIGDMGQSASNSAL